MKPSINAGSRNTDGNVPNVNFNDSKVYVNNYNPDNHNDNLRAREVVSQRRAPLWGPSLLQITYPTAGHL